MMRTIEGAIKHRDMIAKTIRATTKMVQANSMLCGRKTCNFYGMDTFQLGKEEDYCTEMDNAIERCDG